MLLKFSKNPFVINEILKSIYLKKEKLSTEFLNLFENTFKDCLEMAAR